MSKQVKKNHPYGFYEEMLLIRNFENLLFELFESGDLSGTIHTSNGQEAIAVGIINNLNEKDIVISNHRCHGHYIAYAKEIEGLLAEIVGKDAGVCKGRGGSQHLHRGNFFSNGILGNMIPVAAGMGYGEKFKGSNSITTVFIGDGAFGEGTIYETLNIISLWDIPMLVVIENNGYAQSTPISRNFAGTFRGRVEGFGIQYSEIESNDVNKIYEISKIIIDEVRLTNKPQCILINTYRLSPHSKGDDDRSKKEIEVWKRKDPIKIAEKELQLSIIKKIKNKVSKRIIETKELVLSMPNSKDN